MINGRNRSLHLFYSIVPLLAYFGVNFSAVLLGSWFHWNHLTINVIAQVTSFIVLYFVFYRFYDRILSVEEQKKQMLPVIAYFLIFLLGVCSSLALNGWVSILHLNQKITSYQQVAVSIYSGSWLIIVVRTVFLASFVEELLMRGLCYRALSHIVGKVGAMFLSAFLFAIIHGNLLQGLYACILGVLFAFIYEHYHRKLFVPVLAHMAANMISVIGTIVPEISLWMAQNLFLITIVSTVLVFVAVLGVHLCNGKRITKQNPDS